MKTTKHKVTTYYKLVMSFYDPEQTMIASWVGGSFNSIDEAKAHWQSEFRERNKNDEYDSHYNNMPFAVEAVTTVSVLMVEN